MASTCYKIHLGVKVLNRYEEDKGILKTFTVLSVDQTMVRPTIRGQSPYFQGGQSLGYRFLSEHTWLGAHTPLYQENIFRKVIFLF